ncbi:hypothetical protein BC829DRAFT_387868 [Chytridium lagenaria]|nr:hypothetical protein BC829DRAFT_387868 [Chytridium lagenaria]
MVRGVINRLLAGLMRKVFLEMWVLPSWRHYFLPMMIPSPQEELARQLIINSIRSSTSKRHGHKSLGASLWERRMALAKAAKSSPFTQQISSSSSPPSNYIFPDVLVLHAFPITPNVAGGQTGGATSNGDGITVSAPSESTSGQVEQNDTMEWRTLKNKASIVLQKRKVVVGSSTGEVTRARINIRGDVERVYACLDDGYMETDILSAIGKYASVRKSTFVFNKGNIRDVLFLEVRGSLRDLHRNANVSGSFDLNASSAYVVVRRSIGEFRDNDVSDPVRNTPTMFPKVLTEMERIEDDARRIFSAYTMPGGSWETLESAADTHFDDAKPHMPPSKFSPERATGANPKRRTAPIYVLGYLIEPNYLDASTYISRLELDFAACRRIKAYVETLLNGAKTSALGHIFAAAANASNSASGSFTASLEMGGVRRRVFNNSTASSATSPTAAGESTGYAAGSEKRIDKLKSLVSSTASYLMRNRRGNTNTQTQATQPPLHGQRTSSLVDVTSLNTESSTSRPVSGTGAESFGSNSESAFILGSDDFPDEEPFPGTTLDGEPGVDAISPDYLTNPDPSSGSGDTWDLHEDPPAFFIPSEPIAMDQPKSPVAFESVSEFSTSRSRAPISPLSESFSSSMYHLNLPKGGRGFGFLRRGGGSSGGNERFSTLESDEFSNSNGAEGAPSSGISASLFSEIKFEGRGDGFKHHVTNSVTGAAEELVIEFSADADNLLSFSCIFNQEDDDEDRRSAVLLSLLSSEAMGSPNHTQSHLQILYPIPCIRRFITVIPSYLLPRGFFILSWESSSSSSKKASKTLRFRTAFRTLSPLRSLSASHISSILSPPNTSTGRCINPTTQIEHLAGIIRTDGPLSQISFFKCGGKGCVVLDMDVGIAGYDCAFSVLFTPVDGDHGGPSNEMDGASVGVPGLSSPFSNLSVPSFSAGKLLRQVKTTSTQVDVQSDGDDSNDSGAVTSPSVTFASGVAGGGNGGGSGTGGGGRIVGRLRGKGSSVPTASTTVERTSIAGNTITGATNAAVISSGGFSGMVTSGNGGGGCSGWIPLFADDELSVMRMNGEDAHDKHVPLPGSALLSRSPPPHAGPFFKRVGQVASSASGMLTDTKTANTRITLGNRPGVFTFVLDNSHSMVLSKTISIRAGIRSMTLVPETAFASPFSASAPASATSKTSIQPFPPPLPNLDHVAELRNVPLIDINSSTPDRTKPEDLFPTPPDTEVRHRRRNSSGASDGSKSTEDQPRESTQPFDDASMFSRFSPETVFASVPVPGEVPEKTILEDGTWKLALDAFDGGRGDFADEFASGFGESLVDETIKAVGFVDAVEGDGS